MAQRDPERYTQGDDGLIAEKVGSWAVDKLKIVTDYVYASGGARKKYAGTGAAYIDPFCGPGRSLIRDTTRFIDGSPVAAFKRALESPGRFTSINISDGDDGLLDAATKRLTTVDAPVRPPLKDAVEGDEGGLRGSLPPWVNLTVTGNGGRSQRAAGRKTASPPLRRTRKFCRSSSCWATTRFMDR